MGKKLGGWDYVDLMEMDIQKSRIFILSVVIDNVAPSAPTHFSFFLTPSALIVFFLLVETLSQYP